MHRPRAEWQIEEGKVEQAERKSAKFEKTQNLCFSTWSYCRLNGRKSSQNKTGHNYCPRAISHETGFSQDFSTAQV